jgi:hypothetical protein
MVTASCSMASRLFMSTPSRAAVQRSWKRAGIPGHPDPATTMENDASALQNMGHPDDAALLESRARDIRGQTCLTSGQTALYFAPDDTNALVGAYPTRSATSRLDRPCPLLRTLCRARAAGAAGKIWEGLGNLCVSPRLPLA